MHSVSETKLKIMLSQPRYMIVFKPLDEDLYSVFEKEYPEDNAGVDLYCRDDVEIAPGEMAMLKLGLVAKLVGPEYGEDPIWLIRNYHYWLLPRSSISKKGLIMANSVGVIDKSYRGELMGAVVNVSGKPVTVKRGERLFQIVAPDMGYIFKATKALEYNNEATEAEYLMKEKEYTDALSEIKWSADIVFASQDVKTKWLEYNDKQLYLKLYTLKGRVDEAAERRPSFVSRLNEIEDGKWIAIIDGGVFGPFESKYALEKALENAAFKHFSIKITSMAVNKRYLKATIMDDTSRGAGGFGSTGQ